MPHDAVTLRHDILPKNGFGGHDQVVREEYIAPADGDGGVADDPHQRMDLANARWMLSVLNRAYPLYPWRTVYDGHQKMAYLSIPILMGVNKFWAINLVTDQLTKELLVRAGGELLERYKQSRERFDLGSFLTARQKHSALIIPSRAIPG